MVNGDHGLLRGARILPACVCYRSVYLNEFRLAGNCVVCTEYFVEDGYLLLKKNPLHGDEAHANKKSSYLLINKAVNGKT